MNRVRLFPVVLLLLAGCTSVPAPPVQSEYPSLSLPSALEREIDEAVSAAIAGDQFPGGVLLIGNDDRVWVRSWGSIAGDGEIPPADTIYDLASLTKVMATAPAVLHLVEKGRLGLDDPISRWFPELPRERRGITVRHLLTHTSGLPPGLDMREEWNGYEEGVFRAVEREQFVQEGSVFRYSDVNYLLLGELVRRVSGKPMHELVREKIYDPLGLEDTRFVPPGSILHRIAPTQLVDGTPVHGVVHDPTSQRMGGIAGNAGLFSTVFDISRFVRMILGRGTLEGVQIFEPGTVELMTTVQSPAGATVRRTAGWDFDSTFSRPRGWFPVGSFGHTGWTGAFLWVDPVSDTYFVFLSNRTWPDGRGSVLALQRELGTIISRFAGYEEFPEDVRIDPRRGTGSVQNGIDRLVASRFEALARKRVGLITNHTGRDRLGNTTIDLLRSARNVDLVKLFSPEHGIRGDVEAIIDDSVDTLTGLPIYSLYGERRKPTAEQLEGLDALVFDIQDIGTRFYTYISTMGLAMEAAAEAEIEFFVLDRINPINGEIVEGPVSDETSRFTDFHPITVRHGMTIGELARMFREERGIDVALTVIELMNWERDTWQDESGLLWVDTSPNIRNLTAAILYPGIGNLETLELSVGRGTKIPFEIIGAPYVEGPVLAARLKEAIARECMRFAPVRFTPDASKFAGEELGGVTIDLVDRDACDIVATGVEIGDILYELYGDALDFDRLNYLLRDPETLEKLKTGDIDEATSHWPAEIESFLERRARYLIYD